MNKDISQIIYAARLLMVGGLVYLHFGTLPGSENDPYEGIYSVTNVIPEFINSMFVYIFFSSVPVLSVISGMLFFRKDVFQYKQELRKRFFTIALPAWTWAALWLIFGYTLLVIGKPYNIFQGFSSYIQEPTYLMILNGIIGITEMPYAYQFWFIHDLILTSILSPIIYWGIRSFKHNFVILIGLLWFFQQVYFPFFSNNILFFFTIGAWISLSGKQLPVNYNNIVPAIVVFLLLVIGRVCIPVYFNGELPYEFQYECITRIAGLYSFYKILCFMSLKESKLFSILIKYSGYSFFIFAFHFPFVRFLKQFFIVIPGSTSSTGQFIIWLFVPLLTIILAIATAKTLNATLPKVFKFLNGQRAGITTK